MKKTVITLITAMAILTAGCGIYSFSPGGKSLIETIAITQFENKTIESGLSGRMTDLVVDAFISDGSLKVVSENDADAVLLGVLSSYKREAYTYDESDNVSQYVVKLVFEVKLLKGDSEEEFWSETFYSEGYYATDLGTSSDSALTIAATEEGAQAQAADKLVSDILNRTTKSW
jgi:hypothetical protein